MKYQNTSDLKVWYRLVFKNGWMASFANPFNSFITQIIEGSTKTLLTFHSGLQNIQCFYSGTSKLSSANSAKKKGFCRVSGQNKGKLLNPVLNHPVNF